MKISDKELNRQTNLVIVNSQSKKAFLDTKEIAEIHLENDERYNAIYTVSDDIGIKKIPYNMISRYPKGNIYAVDYMGRNMSSTLPQIIYQSKYAMFIVSNQNMTVADYNKFLAEDFKKKSLDITKHQPSLLLSDIDKRFIDISIEQAKEGQRIERNVAFRIYPDEDFEFTKEKATELKKQHEIIDVIGLMLTQYCVNQESLLVKKEIYDVTEGCNELVNQGMVEPYVNKYVHYSYFTREISGVSENTVRAGINYLAKELNLKNSITNYAKKIWMNEDEEQEVSETESKNISVEKEISKIAMKVFTGEAIVLNEEQATAFVTKEYENSSIKDTMDIQTFADKVEEEMKKKTKEMGIPII